MEGYLSARHYWGNVPTKSNAKLGNVCFLF